MMIIELRRRTLWEKLARLWPPYRRRSDAAQRDILRTSWDGYITHKAWQHQTLLASGQGTIIAHIVPLSRRGEFRHNGCA
jgi:hypothetical protein